MRSVLATEASEESGCLTWWSQAQKGGVTETEDGKWEKAGRCRRGNTTGCFGFDAR